MPTIDHDGRTIDYIEAGDGPTVILLPPGASPASAWRGVIERLEDRFRLIAINVAGYGGTSPWTGDRPIAVTDEATATAAVITHVRGAADPPPHLVGHSYGGVLSLRIVQSALAEVASLTLIEPGAYPLLDAAGETEALAEAEAINFGFIEAAPRDPETAFRSYIDYYTDGPGSWDALPEKARAKLLDIRANVVAGLAAVHAEPMPLDALSRISLPTRVLQGAATTRSHARICAVLARTIPGATLDVVEGAGHMLSITHADAVAERIADFIGDTTRQSE